MVLGGVGWFSVSRLGVAGVCARPDRPGLRTTSTSSWSIETDSVDIDSNFRPARTGARACLPTATAYAFGTDDGKEAIVWTFDLAPRRRAASADLSAGNNRFPALVVHDGTRLAFQSDREGDLAYLLAARRRHGADAERLTKPAAAGEEHTPESWYPREDVLLFSSIKGSDYLALDPDAVRGRKATPFGAVRSTIPNDAVFSPDGRWVAYTGGGSINGTIYVKPYPLTTATYELPRTVAGAPHHPLWLPGMAALVFNQRAGFHSPDRHHDIAGLRVRGCCGAGPGSSRPARPNVRRAFDVLPDGRLVGLGEPGNPENMASYRQFNVVLNWFDELKARVPGR